MSKEITASQSSQKIFAINKGRQSKLFPESCPHLLPMKIFHVIGAPKINPEIGQVVFNPQNDQQKFIRFLV